MVITFKTIINEKNDTIIMFLLIVFFMGLCAFLLRSSLGCNSTEFSPEVLILSLLALLSLFFLI